jgi:hypothetical protein
MAIFTSKVLWIVGMTDPETEDGLLQQALTTGIGTVCVRSTNARLPAAIARFHGNGIKVYAWRWPAVRPTNGSPHYFASDEADYVVDELMPAGLDGYIADPESDAAGDVNDWNDSSLASLAKAFCGRIRSGATAAGLGNFRIGLTSGCTYPNPGNRPHIPWREFVDGSDVLLPQSYWRVAGGSANGGNPQKAIDRGLTSWGTIANGKPIVPMAGELERVTAEEITGYGTQMKAKGITEGHFYTATAGVSATVWTAIAAL